MTVSDFSAVAISDEADSAERIVELPHGNPPRSTRPCARDSVTQPAPAALPPRRAEVAERDGDPALATVQQAAQQAADDLSARARGWFTGLAAGPPLWDARPPTLREAHQRVHADAGHLNGDLWKALRIIYGYLHLQLKLALNAIEWATRSPWGLLITGFVVFVVWKWI